MQSISKPKGGVVAHRRADGTATMLVELQGWRATLFTPQLRFEMCWSLSNGRLKTRTVVGEPADKVNLILKLLGDRVEEQILELSEQHFVLLDPDGQTKYHWQRVP